MQETEPTLADLESDSGRLAEILEGETIETEETGDQNRLVDPWDPRLIRVEPKTFSIRNILDMLDEGTIELEPDFQRRRVWKPNQKSLLIESILLQIPLPAFYFSADDDGLLQVIDGLQRLSTIYDFVRGGREGKARFKLTELEYLSSQLRNKTYLDLENGVWGRRILTTQILANVVDPQTPAPVKLNIFGRLNRQGTPLSQQELRHAMSKSRSRGFLRRLVGVPEFDRATGSALKDHPRMSDREVALRYCGFQLLTNIQGYEEVGSLMGLLNGATESLDSPEKTPEAMLEEIAHRFALAMRNAEAIFGDQSFRKPQSGAARKPFSRPLFDAWAYYLSRISESDAQTCAEEIRRRYDALFEDEEFVNAITIGTGDVRRVEYRFRAVARLLDQAMGGRLA